LPLLLIPFQGLRRNTVRSQLFPRGRAGLTENFPLFGVRSKEEAHLPDRMIEFAWNTQQTDSGQRQADRRLREAGFRAM
jgi:hypothetical protein